MKSDILAQPRLDLEAGLPLPVDLTLMDQLLDHVPEIAFFLKDRSGRYLAVNQSLVERCGLREKHELLGRRASDIFPKELGELYSSQDQFVLGTARPILDRLELHWYAGRRPGWCLTTKLPLRDRAGVVVGLVGISRDLRAHENAEAIPAGFVKAMEFAHGHAREMIRIPLSRSSIPGFIGPARRIAPRPLCAAYQAHLPSNSQPTDFTEAPGCRRSAVD